MCYVLNNAYIPPQTGSLIYRRSDSNCVFVGKPGYLVNRVDEGIPTIVYRNSGARSVVQEIISNGRENY